MLFQNGFRMVFYLVYIYIYILKNEVPPNFAMIANCITVGALHFYIWPVGMLQSERGLGALRGRRGPKVAAKD